jgi:hypothetical protein
MRAPHPVAARRIKVVLCSLSALFLVLFAFPANLQSFLFGGASDVPLASLFMTWLRNQVLPPGWILNMGNGISELGGQLQPVVLLGEASLVLTLIIGYPLIAFVLFERIVRSGGGRPRRMVYALTSLASAAFFGGVLFGVFFMIKFYIECSGARLGQLLSGRAGRRIHPGSRLDPAVRPAGGLALPELRAVANPLTCLSSDGGLLRLRRKIVPSRLVCLFGWLILLSLLEEGP